MEIEALRGQIDSIDRELVELFKQRMQVSADIAKYKKDNNLPVLDRTRERELLNKIATLSGKELENYTSRLYAQILELSKSCQRAIRQSASVKNRNFMKKSKKPLTKRTKCNSPKMR